MKCASNLRQIGQAITAYATNNNGQLPADFVTIIKSGSAEQQFFFNPATSNKLPEKLELASDAERAKWVSDNCDYVYCGSGMTMPNGNAHVLIAYEKQGPKTSEGTNFLYADGQVEFKKADDARKELDGIGQPAK